MADKLPFKLTKTTLFAKDELEATNPSLTNRTFNLNTTLNHKYSNYATKEPAGTQELLYFGIGVKGFRNLDTGVSSAPYVPYSSNKDLFEPLPFRVVSVNADLSAAERANYRMRVRQTFNGEDYWCYYLKKIVFPSDSIKIVEINMTTGEENIVTEFDEADLTPSPTNTTAEDAIVTNFKRVAIKDAFLPITGAEVTEAVNIIYGDLLRAKISEIGLYAGSDESVTALDGSGNSVISMQEAIYARLAYHYTDTGENYFDSSKVNNKELRIQAGASYLT